MYTCAFKYLKLKIIPLLIVIVFFQTETLILSSLYKKKADTTLLGLSSGIMSWSKLHNKRMIESKVLFITNNTIITTLTTLMMITV